ncbi:hypothetical protein [Pseudomonas sp. S32]|uniref:hypothetical protein n=1 Tax=Pseudomonas sp. S32 TaxID=2767448 RepID=UPI001911F947|nr:hypothetical protein [Pseudomonas sp. S32]MBK5003488.1 hypothetical protein [Pseudomonas sp. S32]
MKSMKKRDIKAATKRKPKAPAKRKSAIKPKRAKGKGKPLQRPFPLGCSRTFTTYVLTYCIAR